MEAGNEEVILDGCLLLPALAFWTAADCYQHWRTFLLISQGIRGSNNKSENSSGIVKLNV